jgi:hypothetical protein
MADEESLAHGRTEDYDVDLLLIFVFGDFERYISVIHLPLAALWYFEMKLVHLFIEATRPWIGIDLSAETLA